MERTLLSRLRASTQAPDVRQLRTYASPARTMARRIRSSRNPGRRPARRGAGNRWNPTRRRSRGRSLTPAGVAAGRRPGRRDRRPERAGRERRRRPRSGVDREAAQDLVQLGEAPGLVLRPDQVAIHHDVEHALVTLDQHGFYAAILANGGCQTGSLRQVVSNHAVGDRDVHDTPRRHRQGPEGFFDRSGVAPRSGRGALGRCGSGGADGTRTRDLRRDRPAFWTD